MPEPIAVLITDIKYMIEQLKAPEPFLIKKLRDALYLTQSQASAMVHSNQRSWQKWEAGDRTMDLKTWELFLIKCLQKIP